MGLVITLLIVGAVFLLIETLLPGIVAGVAGLLCLVAGVALAYSRLGAGVGSLILMGLLLVLGVGTALWIKYLPRSPLARRFIAKRTIGDIDAGKPDLLQQTGVAQSPLRPSGVAIINGRRVDVITEGSMIEPGAPVRVVAVEGMRVVVRAA